MKSDKHAVYMQQLTENILEQPGVIESSFRHQLKDRGVAYLSGQDTETVDGSILPSSLANYVKKVARHAYKVTDTDIQGLRELGYSEDAIFEITLSTALGIGLITLEQGLRVLRSEER